jgi:hypothetical protein
MNKVLLGACIALFTGLIGCSQEQATKEAAYTHIALSNGTSEQSETSSRILEQTLGASPEIFPKLPDWIAVYQLIPE